MVRARDRRHGSGPLKALVDCWRPAFPDVSGTVESIVEDERTVAGEVTFVGIHSGPFPTTYGGQIPPSGRAATIEAVSVQTYDRGSLARVAHYFDLLGMLRAIGAA